MTLDSPQMLDMYRKMATIRAFDRRAVEEFHAGNIPGVVHAYIGEEAVAAVGGMAIISTAVTYLLYFGILASAGATNVLLVTFLIPISALLLGMGVLGEVIRILEYIGMGCIFLGLMLIDGRVLSWIRKRFYWGSQFEYSLNIQKGK